MSCPNGSICLWARFVERNFTVEVDIVRPSRPRGVQSLRVQMELFFIVASHRVQPQSRPWTRIQVALHYLVALLSDHGSRRLHPGLLGVKERSVHGSLRITHAVLIFLVAVPAYHVHDALENIPEEALWLHTRLCLCPSIPFRGRYP